MDNEQQRQPKLIESLVGLKVKEICAGYHHSMALTSKSGLYCWGSGWSGQLGTGNTKDLNTPTFVDTFQFNTKCKIVKIAAGYHHSLALTDDGRIYTWGYGEVGQLGHGNSIKRVLTPKCIEGLSDVKFIDISASEHHTLALTSDGKVYSWGLNRFNQLGYSTDDSTYQSTPKVVPIQNIITSISAGTAHSLAVSSDGALYYWGRYVLSGEIFNSPKRLDLPEAFFIKVSTKLNHCLALTNKGEIWAFGYNEHGQCGTSHFKPVNEPTLIKGCNGLFFTDIVAGGNHSLALIGGEGVRDRKVSTGREKRSKTDYSINYDVSKIESLSDILEEEKSLSLLREDILKREKELMKEKEILLEKEKALNQRKKDILKEMGIIP